MKSTISTMKVTKLISGFLAFSLFLVVGANAQTVLAENSVTKVKNLLFSKEATEIEEKIDERTECEIFDNILSNTFDIEDASLDTKQKIEKVEDTLEEEALKRETIFGNIKQLFTAKTKDKIIFKEMRKQIDDAKKYYEEVDTKVDYTFTYLEATDCEDTNRVDILEADTEVEALKTEEATYRKQLVGSLRDKVKLLQEELEAIKK